MTEDNGFSRLTRRHFIGTIPLAAFGATSSTVYAGVSHGVTASILDNRFAGSWLYRSFRNVSDPARKLEDILFWEADLDLIDKGSGRVEGTIADTTDKLTVKGSCTFGFPNYLRFEANGVAGSETVGWRYNYIGFLVPDWPDGIEQRDSIVGTVIRTVEHSNGKAKAGYVASFVCVRI